jgi:beta-fructofuranosidase
LVKILLMISVATLAGAGEEDLTKDYVARAEASVKAVLAKAENDPTRPVFHFRPRAQWMNEVCGAIKHKDWYHVFYLFNPHGDKWSVEGTCWGHARSRDLVRWEHLPIAIAPMLKRGEWQCASGCVTIDGNKKPMIFYTFVPARRFAARMDKREHWGAVPLDDDLIKWKRVKKYPLMAASKNGVPFTVPATWTDPYVFRDSGRTYALFRSSDGTMCEAMDKPMTRWMYARKLSGVGNDCSCFFRLGTRWVLLRETYPPEYSIGQLDIKAKKFTPAGSKGILDYAYGPKLPGHFIRGFAGARVMFDTNGRCIVVGWVSGFKPKHGWHGCMSLPRILKLAPGPRLLQSPAPELEKLRGERVSTAGFEMSDESKPIEGLGDHSIEVMAEFEPAGAKAFGIKLSCPRKEKYAAIIRCEGKQLDVAGTALKLGSGHKSLKLRIFFDRSVLEVFVNDGEQVVTRVVYPGDKPLVVSVFSEGGATRVKSLEAWPMKSAW